MFLLRLTIANQMLSLIGSIQADPFSPEHLPDHTIQTTAPKAQRQPKVPEPEPVVEDEDEAAASEEEDTFQALGRLGDEAVARRAKAEEEVKNEKKRKRKGVKEAGPDVEEAQVEKKKKKKKTS